MDSEVSLRPLSLKPGGGKANPFAGFGKGAGAGIKKQVTIPHAATHWRQGGPAGTALLLHAVRVVLQSSPFRAQASRLLIHASSVPFGLGCPVYLSCNESWTHVPDHECACSAAICLTPLQARSPLARLAFCALRALALCNRARRSHWHGLCAGTGVASL